MNVRCCFAPVALDPGVETYWTGWIDGDTNEFFGDFELRRFFSQPTLLGFFSQSALLGFFSQSLLFGFLFWSEIPDALSMAGIAVIAASGAYIVRSEN